MTHLSRVFWGGVGGLLLLLTAPAPAQIVTYQDGLKPTEQESQLDAQVQTCLDPAIWPEDFSFSEWSARLHYFSRKMIQRLSSEYASAIASQKSKVLALRALSATCPALAPVVKELGLMQRLYETKIVYESGQVSTGLFEDEEVNAKMDKGDVEELLKLLEKIHEKAGISRRIIRWQEE
ncbi:MAG: hypothetical protein HC913_14075 [Microscillaceae bacterium]|nr:hypothetical protein [Microscillaceae bacterium]